MRIHLQFMVYNFNTENYDSPGVAMGCQIFKQSHPKKTGWWLSQPSEKYESQLGWLFPIYGKIKNVPNHQPEENCTHNTWNLTFSSCQKSEVSAEDFVWFSRLIPRLLRILHLPPYGVWIWFSISKFCYHGAMFQRLTQMTHRCSFTFLRSLCPSCVDSMVDYMIKSWVVCTSLYLKPKKKLCIYATYQHSIYPLVNCYITMENHHVQWENPL